MRHLDGTNLTRIGYQTYRTAAGNVIERTTNPNALPCFRWRVIDGPAAGQAGFQLRALATKVG